MMSRSSNPVAPTTLTTPVSLIHEQSLNPTASARPHHPKNVKVPGATPSFRQRDHQYSALPVKTLLKVRMRDLELTNSDLQRVMGYDRPNVVAMMRSGTMRLPVGKVAEVARKLQVDPVFLLGKVLAENDAALWEVISSVMGDRLITANEMRLVNLVRKVLDGHDVDLAEDGEFAQVVTASLAKVVERQKALNEAALVAIDGTVNGKSDGDRVSAVRTPGINRWRGRAAS